MSINYKISDDELEGLINSYCRDMTAWAAAGRFDPIFGRDKELEQTIMVLLQKGRKNVAFLAPAGVGKTALAVALAQAVNDNKVPDYLKGARVLELDLASMAAGTSSIAEFQGRFIPIVKGIAERYHDPDLPQFILFIDEMHTIMPTCEGSSYRGLSEVMKPYLTVGDIHVIGATTSDEHRMFVAVDPAMDRRFQKVLLDVPDTEQTVRILEAIKAGYEKHHGIEVDIDICNLIVDLTDKHMRKRNQPDKAITTMDAAMARQVMERGKGGALTKDSVFYVVNAETGVHVGALDEDA